MTNNVLNGYASCRQHIVSTSRWAKSHQIMKKYIYLLLAYILIIETATSQRQVYMNQSRIEFYKIVVKSQIHHLDKVKKIDEGSEMFCSVDFQEDWCCYKDDKQIIPFGYSYIGSPNNGMISVNKGGKVVVRKEKNIKIIINGGKWGAYNLNGDIKVPIQFDYISDFQDGLAAVCIGNLEAAQYPQTYINSYPDFSKLNDTWELIEKGTVDFIEFEKYKYIEYCIKPIMYQHNVGEGGKWGFVDTTGKIVVPLIFEGVGKFSSGLAAVKKEGKWGYINKKGDFVLPAQFTSHREFEAGSVIINSNTAYNSSGKLIISPNDKFQIERVETNGLIRVSRNGVSGCNLGFVDSLGRVVTELKYKLPNVFSEGLISAYDCELQKIGYIDTYGNVSIPFVFETDIFVNDIGLYSMNFEKGYAIVENGEFKEKNYAGIIDKKGKYILRCDKKLGGYVNIRNNLLIQCNCKKSYGRIYRNQNNSLFKVRVNDIDYIFSPENGEIIK